MTETINKALWQIQAAFWLWRGGYDLATAWYSARQFDDLDIAPRDAARDELSYASEG